MKSYILLAFCHLSSSIIETLIYLMWREYTKAAPKFSLIAYRVLSERGIHGKLYARMGNGLDAPIIAVSIIRQSKLK